MHLHSLVSVFVPYYNDQKFLPECIDSVLAQTYTNFELFLVNHASTDASRSIAHSYNDPRIKHIDLSLNYGAGGGLLLNAFLKEASGSYTKLFCADDIMLPDCLETLAGYLQRNPATDVVFGDMTYVDEQGISQNDSWFNSRPFFDSHHGELDHLKNYAMGISCLPYPAVCLKTACLKTAHIHSSFVMLFDMALWSSLIIQGFSFKLLHYPVVMYRVHPDQVSAVQRQDLAERRSYFEALSYLDLFYDIASVEWVRHVYTTSFNQRFMEKIAPHEKDLIPFIIAHYYLHSEYPQFKMHGYLKMQELLDHPQYRDTIHAKFDFSIGDFRALYSTAPPLRAGMKHKVYTTPIKELGFGALVFLAFRKVLNAVKFWMKPYKTKRRRSL
jgi:glycosyltransferase involved in cell wall biosynthesis